MFPSRHETKPVDTKDRSIGCDILPKEADHSKCKESIKSNETIISDLKKQIESHTKSLKNEQNLLKNIQVCRKQSLESSALNLNRLSIVLLIRLVIVDKSYFNITQKSYTYSIEPHSFLNLNKSPFLNNLNSFLLFLAVSYPPVLVSYIIFAGKNSTAVELLHKIYSKHLRITRVCDVMSLYFYNFIIRLLAANVICCHEKIPSGKWNSSKVRDSASSAHVRLISCRQFFNL